MCVCGGGGGGGCFAGLPSAKIFKIEIQLLRDRSVILPCLKLNLPAFLRSTGFASLIDKSLPLLK